MKKLLLLSLLITNTCFCLGKWECIDRTFYCHTWRFKTNNGWIVSGDNSSGGGSENTYAMTFVPDPKHEWEL